MAKEKKNEKMLNIKKKYQRNVNKNYNELSPHTGEHGRHQKIYKQYILEKVWKKGNPLTLLVEMQTGTTTVEESMEVPKKLKIELLYDLAIPLLGTYLEKIIM